MRFLPDPFLLRSELHENRKGSKGVAMLDSETRRELHELEIRCIDGRIELLKLMNSRDRIWVWMIVAIVMMWVGVVFLKIELSSVKKQLSSMERATSNSIEQKR